MRANGGQRGYPAPMTSRVIATGLREVLAALTAAGVPDNGAQDDVIGSARVDGIGLYGIYRVVYENLIYRLELDPDDEVMGWIGPDVTRWTDVRAPASSPRRMSAADC